MRSSAAALAFVAAVSVLGGAGACSSPKSFIVLQMHSADTTEIRGVTQIGLTITQAPSFSATLTYPTKTGESLVINAVDTSVLSVSFGGARSGAITFSVEARDGTGCVVGAARGLSTTIRQGAISNVVIALQAASCAVPDGGVDALEAGVTFPGCDPVTPACMSGDTCQVNCMSMKGECTAGGKGGPGAVCATNKDCAPGSQCFDYAGAGCAVKVCLRFCDGDDRCSPGGVDAGAVDGGSATGTGTRSVCQGLVSCPVAGTMDGVITGYHTCTFGCDPRLGAATVGTTGCPPGLSCIVVGAMDQVDCACAGATRTGTDGSNCTSGADCAPGFICNEMAGAKVCRAVCRCDAKDMLCKTPNECAGAKTCTALTNDTTFGVCL